MPRSASKLRRSISGRNFDQKFSGLNRVHDYAQCVYKRTQCVHMCARECDALHSHWLGPIKEGPFTFPLKPTNAQTPKCLRLAMVEWYAPSEACAQWCHALRSHWLGPIKEGPLTFRPKLSNAQTPKGLRLATEGWHAPSEAWPKAFHASRSHWLGPRKEGTLTFRPSWVGTRPPKTEHSQHKRKCSAYTVVYRNCYYRRDRNPYRILLGLELAAIPRRAPALTDYDILSIV